MSVAHEREQRRAAHHARAWREFKRARYTLWALLACTALAGVVLHGWITTSIPARVVWLGAVVAVIGVPLRYLFRFRCPRCGGVYLATGSLADFLGLGRILWSNQCGSCALPVGDGSREHDAPDSHRLA